MARLYKVKLQMWMYMDRRVCRSGAHRVWFEIKGFRPNTKAGMNTECACVVLVCMPYRALANDAV